MSKLCSDWRDFLVALVCIIVIGGVCLCAHRERMAEKDPMDAHYAMQANDRVTACAMRVHMLEQRIDMHELRLEEMELKVFGTNFNMEATND